MNPADNIERAIEQLHITTKAETDKHILDDAFAAFRGAAQRQKPGIGAGIWRVFVMSRMARPAAAAAVILVALALFFGITTKKAVTIEQIYEGLGKTGNICISTFQAGKTMPYRQVWASQTLEVKLFKIGSKNQAQFVLWDIPNKVKMIRYLSLNAVQTEAITEQMLAELEKSVAPFSGLVPFSDVSDVPEDAQWNRIDDREVAAIAPGTKAYDLTWIQKSTPSEAVVHRKWRVFVDSRTNLPKRAEWYAKFTSEGGYILKSFVVVTYPSESEIQALVQNTFRQPERRPGEPEYMGTPGADRRGTNRKQ